MSKEYLDRKEIEEILKDLISDSHGIKRATIEQDIKYALTQICQLKPKNQKVIFKAKLEKGIILNKIIEQVLYPTYLNKKIKIILEEE